MQTLPVELLPLVIWNWFALQVFNPDFLTVCTLWTRIFTNINTLPLSVQLSIKSALVAMKLTRTVPKPHLIASHYAWLLSDHDLYMKLFFRSYRPKIWQHMRKPTLVDLQQYHDDFFPQNAPCPQYIQKAYYSKCHTADAFFYGHNVLFDKQLSFHILADGYLLSQVKIGMIHRTNTFTLKHLHWLLKKYDHCLSPRCFIHVYDIITILQLLIREGYSAAKIRLLYHRTIAQFDFVVMEERKIILEKMIKSYGQLIEIDQKKKRGQVEIAYYRQLLYEID